MIVNEIFSSIDGEGLRTGELATFIRLAGCNLHCRYCDTEYALDRTSGTEMSIEEILNEIKKYKNKNITLTGGEPLVHKNIDELIDALIKNNYFVNIETNGSIKIDKYVKKCLITMDYKCKSSLMENKMLLSNIEKLGEKDVLKFVINANDFKCVEKILKEYNIKSYIYLSPIFNEIELPQIVEFMKKCNENGINMSKVRMQVQLHKIVWNPEMRGV